jgi:tetratricopeptide (TPR) repeat protein
VEGPGVVNRIYNRTMHNRSSLFIVSLARKVTVYCCLVISVQPLVARAQEISSEVREHFAAARQAQDAGSLDKAVQEYLAVTRLRSALPEAYVNLGLVYYAQSKFEDSARALATASKLRPGMRGVSLWLGIDDVKLNRPVQGVVFLREAIRMDPADKMAQSWLGTALWNAGESTAAVNQLARANELFPSDLDIHFVLGEAYRKAADEQIEAVLTAASGQPLLNQVYGDIYKDQRAWSKAATHYRLAVEKDSTWKGAHLGLGEVYLYQEKWADAQKEFRSELNVDPSSAASYAHLAEAALVSNDSNAALDMLSSALRISPDATCAAVGMPPSYATLRVPLSEVAMESLRESRTELQKIPASASRDLALSIVDQRLGLTDFDRDWISFQQAVHLPAVPGNLYSLSTIEFDRQQFRKADASLRLWLQTHPKDLNAQYLLAKTLRNLSLQVLSELLTMDPTSARAHQLQAQTYQNREEDDKALAEYHIVEQLDPSLPGLHFEIGHLLWKTGDAEQATEELKQELRLNPEHPEANGEMGTILVTQHQPDKAIPYLETALRAKPNLWLIHQQLGKAYVLQKNYPRAEVELRKALAIDLDGTAHYQLGLLYRAEGKSDAADKEFEAARKIKVERLDVAQ